MRLTLIILALLTLAPLQAQDRKAKKEIVSSSVEHGRHQVIFEHTMSAKPGGVLELKDLHGDVVIHGTSSKHITIVEKIRLDRHGDGRNRGDDKDEAEEYAEELSGWLELIPDETPVYIFRVERRRSRDVSVNYKISIPNKFGVYVKSFGGDVDLDELVGEINIKTGGGDIAVANTTGKIVLKTSGGDIDVFKADGQVDMFTSGGDIEGRGVEGKVFAKTGGGDIELISSKGVLDTETGGGDIDLRDFDGTSIKARTGGGDFELSNVKATVNLMTGGGDIDVDRMTGDLEVATGGGDITLQHADGDMTLYTNNGDIDAERVDGAMRVRSGGGDIEISRWTLKGAHKGDSVIETRDGDVSVEIVDETVLDIQLKILDTSPRHGMKQIYGNLDFDISRKEGNTIGWYGKKNPTHTIKVETREGSITINRSED